MSNEPKFRHFSFLLSPMCSLNINLTYQLKKWEEFETVLVSISQCTSEENHSKSKLKSLKFTQDPELKKKEWLIKMKMIALSKTLCWRQLGAKYSVRIFFWTLFSANFAKKDAVPTIFNFAKWKVASRQLQLEKQNRKTSE